MKGGQVVQGDTDEATAVRDNPCSQILREMLRAKKELLSQLNRMTTSFLGDTQQCNDNCNE